MKKDYGEAVVVEGFCGIIGAIATVTHATRAIVGCEGVNNEVKPVRLL